MPDTKQTSSTLAAALEYLRSGFCVVPNHAPVVGGGCTCGRNQCSSAGKHPVESKWQEKCLSEEQIVQAFTGPHRNVGIHLGAKSTNLVDIDLDAPQALQMADLFLPSTESVFGRASKPRSHRIFMCHTLPRTEKFRDINGEMLVEVRSDRSQTIFPGSTHASGEPVLWDLEGEPAALESGPLRATVAKLATAALLARHWPAKGGRQDAALALAGGLLRSGWNQDEVAEFIKSVAAAAGDEEVAKRGEAARYTAQRLATGIFPATGWPHLIDAIGEKVIDRARLWLGIQSMPEPNTSWDSPLPFADVVVPRFPTETLPPIFRAFVEQEADALQVPPDLPGVLVLGVGAASGAGRCAVQVNDGWVEPVNVFFAVALDSGERKSPVFRDAVAPLEEREQELISAALPAIEEARVAWEVMNTRAQQAKRDAAKAKTEEERQKLMSEATKLAQAVADMAVPVVPRLLADDTTSEALASLLADQHGRMALMSTEGGIFETMAGRYADGNLNVDVYLKGYSGDQFRVDRKSRPPEFVPHPMLTLCLAVQPTIISGLALKPGFRGRGLIARFLFSLPPSRVGFREVDPPPLPEETRRAYHAAVKAVLRIPDNRDGKHNLLQLSPLARDLLITFQAELEPNLAPGAELHFIRDWCLKLTGAIARLAGILHLLENAGDTTSWKKPINEMTMASAINLGRYFIGHAKAAFCLMGSDEATEDAKHVLAWILRSEASSFRKQEVWQATKGRFAKVDPLNAALRVLMERGYIKERFLENQGPGRKPAPYYDVNPSIGTYNSSNPYNSGVGCNSRDFRNSRMAIDNEIRPSEFLGSSGGQPLASIVDEDYLEI